MRVKAIMTEEKEEEGFLMELVKNNSSRLWMPLNH